jgi:phosphoesterase RecJ-like protein
MGLIMGANDVTIGHMNELAVKAQEIKVAVESSKRILLHCHPSPDPDSYGSALGLAQVLRTLGKEVTVIKGDSPIPDFAQFLPGAELVVPKNYLELNPTDYDLFIVLDSGGLDRISTLGPVNFPDAMTTILIDHHATTAPFANVSWVDVSYAATAEMLAELVETLGWPLDRESALCFLLGIYTDTGGFKYPATTSRTLAVASRLAVLAPDYSSLIFKLENNNTPGSIYFQALALSSIEVCCGGRVALSILPHERLRGAMIKENDAKGVTIANILKSVSGWDIGITIFEWEPGVIKLSARTRDAKIFDLTKFAVAIGGGGHRAAIGAYLQLPLEEAKSKIIAELKANYPVLVD